MRKHLALLCYVIPMVSACTMSYSEKPKDLIKEDKMVAIQMDLSLIEVLQKTYPGEVIADSILGMPYIYAKYSVDSLQLAESETYYAKNPKQYARIYTRVKIALDQKIDSINRVIQKIDKKK